VKCNGVKADLKTRSVTNRWQETRFTRTLHEVWQGTRFK